MRFVFAAAMLSSLILSTQSQAQPSIFERCMACHAGTEASKDLGPNLTGVYGRIAGSREDFRYSRALSRSGITWDDKSLDAFLKEPAQFVPGTRMPFEGLASDAERAAIIQFLKTLK